MFEEICLVCGKHLQDDRRAYCSDDCQNLELSSPSLSSSSSPLSSPNIGYVTGNDVPALMPSALGNALKVYARRTGYPASSSSASSNSVFTDEEDEDVGRHYVANEYDYHDAVDPIHDTSSKSVKYNYPYSVNSSALSYARRPSGTNNRSTVPHLYRRLSSGSSTGLGPSFPRSAPISSSRMLPDDEDVLSDLASSSGDAVDTDELDLQSEKDWASVPKYSDAAKSRRNRNRASLPPYFSLLQVASPSKDARFSPVSSGSGNTIARPSPPTPKLPSNHTTFSQIKLIPTTVPLTSTLTTPRGRRRETDHSRSSRRSSSSRSPSRARRIPMGASPRVVEGSFRSKVSVDLAAESFDYWGSIPKRRGREPVRRGGSPPPKVFMGVDDSNQLVNAARRMQIGDRSYSGSGSHPRGRARVEDRVSNDAPGYGNGRSGLVDRERSTGMGRILL